MGYVLYERYKIAISMCWACFIVGFQHPSVSPKIYNKPLAPSHPHVHVNVKEQ